MLVSKNISSIYNQSHNYSCYNHHHNTESTIWYSPAGLRALYRLVTQLVKNRMLKVFLINDKLNLMLRCVIQNHLQQIRKNFIYKTVLATDNVRLTHLALIFWKVSFCFQETKTWTIKGKENLNWTLKFIFQDRKSVV